MEHTVARVYTSEFPSGRRCGEFVLRLEVGPEENPSHLGITLAVEGLRSSIESWCLNDLGKAINGAR